VNTNLRLPPYSSQPSRAIEHADDVAVISLRMVSLASRVCGPTLPDAICIRVWMEPTGAAAYIG